MNEELKIILERLATSRWQFLRREHNRMFMALGPGAEWDRYKKQKEDEYREVELLQQFCGVPVS
jgi:hypothetical protein